jgi:ATP-dependent exoDNAse (exonuclease V) alpha subunit
MAIYHLSVKPISRAGGRSATAAAAYRSGELVHDLTSDEVFDYTRKRGVEHSEIVLPTAAARADINWARDREALWNAAEIAEVRKDARVAREYEVALPHELNRGQRVELVRAFSAELANRYGVAVDFSIHAPHRNGDERNHHAHIMTTTREVTATGLGPKAAIEWSDTDRRKKGLEPAKTEVEAIRERWAALTNEHLLERGIEARVDHRSLQEQGIDREPQSHLGPAVSGMERRGMETEVGKRISWEMQASAQARLERAAEIGKLAREREQLQLSTLDLSGDLKLAKEERARAVPEPKAKDTADMSLAERLDMLSDNVAKRLEAEAAPERAAREEEARRRALDVTQQQDLKRGQNRSLGRSLGDADSPSPDDDDLTPKRNRGKGFGMGR